MFSLLGEKPISKTDRETPFHISSEKLTIFHISVRKLTTFHLLVKKLTLHQPVNDLGNKVKNTPIDYLDIAFDRSEKQWMFHQSNRFKYTLPQIVWCGAGF